MRATNIPKEPPIGRFTITLANAIGDQPSEAMKDKLKALIKYGHCDALHPRDHAMLVRAVRGLAKRWHDYADRLESTVSTDDERKSKREMRREWK
jgi:hypothetical protein